MVAVIKFFTFVRLPCAQRWAVSIGTLPSQNAVLFILITVVSVDSVKMTTLLAPVCESTHSGAELAFDNLAPNAPNGYLFTYWQKKEDTCCGGTLH